MILRLIITQEAKDDVREAIVYYNQFQKNLGVRFKSAFKMAIKNIRKTPMFQVRYKEIRLLQVKKFPYLIHFHVDEQARVVIILAVISTHRDPKKYWL